VRRTDSSTTSATRTGASTARASWTAAGANLCSSGIGSGAETVIAGIIQIRDPLSDITLHVVEAPPVPFLLPDWVRLIVGVSGIPCHFIERSGIRGVCAGARGIFPLRF